MSLFLGATVVSGAAQFLQASRQADFDDALQEANNAEAVRAGAEKQASISMNINEAYNQFTRTTSNIDISKMQTRAEAVVSAAAAGTAGLSVNDQLLDIERNAARAEGNERESLHFTVAELERSRRGVSAEVRSRQTHNDYSGPSFLSSALKTGLGYASATYGKTWDFQSSTGTTPSASTQITNYLGR